MYKPLPSYKMFPWLLAASIPLSFYSQDSQIILLVAFSIFSILNPWPSASNPFPMQFLTNDLLVPKLNCNVFVCTQFDTSIISDISNHCLKLSSSLIFMNPTIQWFFSLPFRPLFSSVFLGSISFTYSSVSVCSLWLGPFYSSYARYSMWLISITHRVSSNT